MMVRLKHKILGAIHGLLFAIICAIASIYIDTKLFPALVCVAAFALGWLAAFHLKGNHQK